MSSFSEKGTYAPSLGATSPTIARTVRTSRSRRTLPMDGRLSRHRSARLARFAKSGACIIATSGARRKPAASSDDAGTTKRAPLLIRPRSIVLRLTENAASLFTVDSGGMVDNRTGELQVCKAVTRAGALPSEVDVVPPRISDALDRLIDSDKVLAKDTGLNRVRFILAIVGTSCPSPADLRHPSGGRLRTDVSLVGRASLARSIFADRLLELFIRCGRRLGSE